MSNYEIQILNLCIQTYYNLYGVMPSSKELSEMLGGIIYNRQGCQGGVKLIQMMNEEEKIMSKNNKINDKALESVVGGVDRQVHNDTVPNANLRTAPGLDSRVKLKLDNGDWVGTTGEKVTKDGYTWYEVFVIGSEDCGGWIAGSLIGY